MLLNPHGAQVNVALSLKAGPFSATAGGSGVIIHDNGTIVTNAHVVAPFEVWGRAETGLRVPPWWVGVWGLAPAAHSKLTSLHSSPHAMCSRLTPYSKSK